MYTLLKTSNVSGKEAKLLPKAEFGLGIYLCVVKVSRLRECCKSDCFSGLPILTRVINVSFKCDFQFGLAQTRHPFDMIQKESYYHYFLMIVFFLIYEKIVGLLKIRPCLCSSLKSNLGIITYS